MTAGCAKSQPATGVLAPASPLPTAGIAGQRVAVYPLTLIAADDATRWGDSLTPRRAALDRADSVIGEALRQRSPEVTWVLPAEMRRTARRGTGMLVDPDQMGTALLRAPGLNTIPDPLRTQMRSLTAAAADRYALVPASLVYTPADAAEGGGRAELTLVLADVRTGAIGWRTVAWASGTGPWDALWRALKTLVPSLP
jgi:hypothetical protein